MCAVRCTRYDGSLSVPLLLKFPFQTFVGFGNVIFPFQVPCWSWLHKGHFAGAVARINCAPMDPVPPVAVPGDHEFYYCLYIKRYFQSIGHPLSDMMLDFFECFEEHSEIEGINKYYSLCVNIVRNLPNTEGFTRDEIAFVQTELLKILKASCATFRSLLDMTDDAAVFNYNFAEVIFTKMCLDDTYEQHFETAKMLIEAVSAGRRGVVSYERVLALYALARKELDFARSTVVVMMYYYDLAVAYCRAQGRRRCSRQQAAMYTLLFTTMLAETM